MGLIHTSLGRHRQTYLIGNVLLVLVIVFQIVTGGRMLSPSNIYNLFAGNAHIFILTIGMVMVVVIGQIDLSVGSVAAFVSMTTALTMLHTGIPWWLGLIFGVAIGVIIGAIQGLLLTKVAVPSFVITLAGMLIFRGIVQWESQGLSTPVPAEFQIVGAGSLPNLGRWCGLDTATVLLGIIVSVVVIVDQRARFRRSLKRGVETTLWIPILRGALLLAAVWVIVWLCGRGASGATIPLSALVVLALAIVYHLLAGRTQFGRHMYAVGGNPVAAHLSGINITRVQFLVMTNMGFLAALAGMVFASRATAAGPQDGFLWELDAIAAVFIGGVAISGGSGTIVGGILGSIVMAVLNNGLLLLGVGSDRAQVIKGVVLLIAVIYSLVVKREESLSIGERVLRTRAFSLVSTK
ncbi:sugar ABC transporter permease [Schaalia sp. ZJ1691]|uniref:ABC transporter permease subunit n=1 Tax=Schaalia sp. ZJ1691 TaxID=2709404 RepID=UPI0013EC9B2B|nr:sugar ABC transporter permease [Schaalia sp. ZJ1691]